jgi:mutator protein MutT
MQCVDVAIGVVKRGPKILICLRKTEGRLGGYWEFPGGKCEAGESLKDCLVRELMEEVAIGVEILEKLTPIQHDYGDLRVTLNPFLCRHVNGEAVPIGCQSVEWIEPGALGNYKFPPANDSLLKEIAARNGETW